MAARRHRRADAAHARRGARARALGRRGVRAREAGAHQVRNDTDDPARVVMFSTCSDPEVCVYPGQRRSASSPAGAARTARGELMNRPEANLDYCDGEKSDFNLLDCETASRGGRGLPAPAHLGRRRARRRAPRLHAVRAAAGRAALAVPLAREQRGVARRRERHADAAHARRRARARGATSCFPGGRGGGARLCEPHRRAVRASRSSRRAATAAFYPDSDKLGPGRPRTAAITAAATPSTTGTANPANSVTWTVDGLVRLERPAMGPLPRHGHRSRTPRW